MEMTEITLVLPYPVSNNTYYRHFRGITTISKRGREYKAEVANLCKFAGITEISGKVAVSLEICPKKPKKDTGYGRVSLISVICFLHEENSASPG